MDDTGTIYDTTGATSRPITAAEWEQLCEMWGTDGWGVFIDLISRDAVMAAKFALDSNASGDDQMKQAIAYQMLMQVVTFQGRMKDAVTAAATEREDDDEPAPPNQELVDPEYCFLLKNVTGRR